MYLGLSKLLALQYETISHKSCYKLLKTRKPELACFLLNQWEGYVDVGDTFDRGL